MNDELLRASDVEAAYGIPEGTLKSWRSRNVGPQSFKTLGRVVYRRSVVEAWIAAQEAAARAVAS